MSRNVILFINAIRSGTFEALKKYEQQTSRQFEPIVLVDEKIKERIFDCNGQNNLPEKVKVLTANFDSASSIRSVLGPIKDRIFTVTAQYENCIQELRQVLPYVPYIPTPTESSLEWATEKKLMRKLMEAYDASLVPKYIEAPNANLETIDEIETSLTYPMVVKPSGLEGSLLVSYVSDRSELEQSLATTYRLAQGSYDEWIKRQRPTVLVEEFMEGDMYTVDVYIDATGGCVFTPAILDITGRKAGFEDFFVYKDILPSGLKVNEERKAQEVARTACCALGLRSITAHVELMHTESGWKIIELGPRIGGDRHDLLERAYGINHIVNDIRNRAGEKPEISRDLQKNVVIYWMYARTEGVLKAVHGLEETKKLSSYVELRQNISIGDPVLFAKNGGDLVVHVTLSNTDKDQLEKDMSAMESAISFDVDPMNS